MEQHPFGTPIKGNDKRYDNDDEGDIHLSIERDYGEIE